MKASPPPELPEAFDPIPAGIPLAWALLTEKGSTCVVPSENANVNEWSPTARVDASTVWVDIPLASEATTGSEVGLDRKVTETTVTVPLQGTVTLTERPWTKT